MLIEDGKGSGRKASVSSVQRLNVSSKNMHRSYYISRDDGLAFNAVYDPMAVAAGEHIAYLKNTSDDQIIVVGTIEFHAVNASEFRIWEVTGTAAAGETVTPTNLNLGSGRTASAEAMKGDTAITGLTTGGQIGSHRCNANDHSEMDFNGALILGPGDAIVVELESGTAGAVTIDILFHMETIGAT